MIIAAGIMKKVPPYVQLRRCRFRVQQLFHTTSFHILTVSPPMSNIILNTPRLWYASDTRVQGPYSESF